MRLFTDNPDMVHIVTRLLAIDIILEVGRVTNLVYGQALKTSGDAVFPAVIAAVFMYVCAVGGTWMFGLHLGLLATGAYIGLTCDECVRAVGMVHALAKRKVDGEETGVIIRTVLSQNSPYHIHHKCCKPRHNTLPDHYHDSPAMSHLSLDGGDGCYTRRVKQAEYEQRCCSPGCDSCGH